MDYAMPGMEQDTMSVMVTVAEQPLKALGGEVLVTQEALEEQGRHARDSLKPVKDSAYGTCVEDRRRAGVLSGESAVEPRYSAAGGPNIYGLYVAELTGYFGDSQADGEERLRQVTRSINAKGIPSGGHKRCAANGGISAVVGLIAGDQREAVQAGAQRRLGDEYDQAAMDEVLANAGAVVASGRYDDWDESVLERVLGDEAGEALEVLEPGDHNASSYIRNEVAGKTVDRNTLHERAGKGSYVQDEAYVGKIENALADGPQAAWKQKVARHAREALVTALVAALPDPEIHQIDLHQ